MKTLTEQVRQAIRDSGMTPYLISKHAGISESVLSRFLNGGGMTLKTLEAVGAVLALEITTPAQREKSKPKR